MDPVKLRREGEGLVYRHMEDPADTADLEIIARALAADTTSSERYKRGLHVHTFNFSELASRQSPHLFSPLVLYGDEALRAVAKEVTWDDLQTVRDAFYPMLARCVYGRPRGAAIAAPQANINLRFFVLPDPQEPQCIINPVFMDKDPWVEYGSEGCLSIPGLEVDDIPRHKRVKVSYLDLNGETRETEVEGFLARVFQHEMDHLDGVLITDRLTEEGKVRHAALLKNLAKQSRRAHRDQEKKAN